VAVCFLGAVIWLKEAHLRSTDEQRLHNARVFSLDLGRATHLVLTYGESRIECVRRNEAWFIECPVVARADSVRMDRLLGALEAMTRVETVTPRQRRSRKLALSDYGLQEPALTVAVSDGVQYEILRLGREAPLGDLLYAKFVSSEMVLGTQRAVLDELPRGIEWLRDRTLLPGGTFRTARLEIQRQEGGFIQLVNSSGAWMLQQPVQARADGSLVEDMLDALYASKIRKFVWDKPAEAPEPDAEPVEVEADAAARAEAYGLAPDTAVARIAVWAGGDDAGMELLLGKPVDKDGQEIYARLRDNDSIYTVDSELLAAFPAGANDLRDKNVFTVDAGAVKYASFQEGDRKLVLHKKPVAGWMIMEPVQWKADEETIDRIVELVSRLRVDGFMETLPTNLAGAGLSPPRTILSINTRVPNGPPVAGDAPTQNGSDTDEEHSPPGNRLLIGSVGRDTEEVYARLSNDETVFTIKAKAVLGLGQCLTDPLIYRDRTMLSVPPENILRITLTRPETEQTVGRSEDGAWTAVPPGTNQVDLATLDQLLFHVAHLRALRIDCQNPRNLAAFGLDRTGTTLTLGLSGEEGIQKSILMGFRAGTDGIYATVLGQDVVFVLPNTVVGDLTRDLVKPIDAGTAPSAESHAPP